MGQEGFLACPHDVKEAGLVHYCSYIGVPELENLLEGEESRQRLMLRVGLMTSELWFKIMRLDAEKLLSNVLALDEGAARDLAPLWEGIKLARRGISLCRLLNQQNSILESELAGKESELGEKVEENPSWQLVQVIDDLDAILRARTGRYQAALKQEDAQEYEMLATRLEHDLREWRSMLTRVKRDLLARIYLPGGISYERFTRLNKMLPLSDRARATDWHDEAMFIVVHEATELWFSVINRELKRTVTVLDSQPVRAWDAVESMRRVSTLQALLAQQIQLPLTMFPSDFLQFRDKLGESSGLESYQFRELEMLGGLRDEVHIHRMKVLGHNANLFVDRLRILSEGRNLTDAFRDYLRFRKLTESDEPKQIAEALRTLYETTSAQPNPHLDVLALCEELVQFERNLRLWRDAHVGMVSQMIGTKMGTGGAASSGVAYLRETMRYPALFPELWLVRTLLTKENQENERSPVLENN
jgi:tryptophan 2,3-dioxygenase